MPGSNGAPTEKATDVGEVSHLRLRSHVAELTEQIFIPERLVLRNPMGAPVAGACDSWGGFPCPEA